MLFLFVVVFFIEAWIKRICYVQSITEAIVMITVPLSSSTHVTVLIKSENLIYKSCLKVFNLTSVGWNYWLVVDLLYHRDKSVKTVITGWLMVLTKQGCLYITYSNEPKVWPPLINSHSFIQTLTNQKSRTVSSWLLIGLNLHERMWINYKRSHFWAPCCNNKRGILGGCCLRQPSPRVLKNKCVYKLKSL